MLRRRSGPFPVCRDFKSDRVQIVVRSSIFQSKHSRPRRRRHYLGSTTLPIRTSFPPVILPLSCPRFSHVTIIILLGHNVSSSVQPNRRASMSTPRRRLRKNAFYPRRRSRFNDAIERVAFAVTVVRPHRHSNPSPTPWPAVVLTEGVCVPRRLRGEGETVSPPNTRTSYGDNAAFYAEVIRARRLLYVCGCCGEPMRIYYSASRRTMRRRLYGTKSWQWSFQKMLKV